MRRRAVLILGGVREGRDLAGALMGRGVRVVTSLAGRVEHPAFPEGEVRIGGFGGPEGLTAWLRDHRICAVIDATHPFAEQISANAATACASASVPLLRLQRPSWAHHPDADTWMWVEQHSEAAAAATRHDRVLLTVGRQRLDAYLDLTSAAVWARMVEPPMLTLPAGWHTILDRGPFTLDAETRLMRRLGIDCLVTKDSGGTLTSAKLEAARAVGARIIIVGRAPDPGSVPSVSSVASAVAWLEDHHSIPR